MAVWTKDIVGWPAVKQVWKVTAQRFRSRSQYFKNKTFEELTAADKDLLLKMIACRRGLIKESPDA